MLSTGIDIPTLLFLIALSHLLLGLLLLLYRRSGERIDALGRWSLAQLIKSAGVAGILIGIVEAWPALRLGANGVLFCGFALEHIAYRRYSGRALRSTAVFAYTLFAFALFCLMLLTPETQRLHWLVAVASVIIASFSGMSAWVLGSIRSHPISEVPMLRMLVWVNGVHCAVSLGRAVLSLSMENHHVASQSMINELAYLAGFILLLANGIGFLLVVQEASDRRLRELSLRDPLTGLYNRRYLQDLLEKALRPGASKGPRFALAMLDLDHFKTINDRYGHAAGDFVLQHFAGVVSRQLRQSDPVARVGGEEFVVLLPGLDADAAAARIQQILDALVDQPLRLGRETHITRFSAGITDSDCADDVDSLQRQADRALYQSKSTGRARVTVYRPDQTPAP